MHNLFTSYLQSRFRLGERELVLSPREVEVLRRYRRPGATEGSAKSGGVARATVRTPGGAGVAAVSREADTEKDRGRERENPGRAEKSLGSLTGRASPEPAAPVRLEVPVGGKPERLAFIAGKVREDETCRMLFQRSNNMVFGTGDPDAAVFFVGEAPGVEEDEQGEPFVGPAGQLLNKMIQAMGLQRSQVYIANICKFRPDMPVGATGNRKPTSAEMAACLPFIRAQIGVVAPRVVVALGATAVEGLFSLPRAPIMKMRGEWMEWDGLPVMPTYHPAFLLRNESVLEKRKVWEDLMQVMEKCGLPVSEKQRSYFRQAAS